MTIHNLKAYIDALWDWGFLDECFKDGCRVSDLDGVVERKGWFLALEGKGSNKPIPRGQMRMFEALASKGWTVLIIWGRPNQPEHMQIWYPHRPKPENRQKADIGDIRNKARGWFNWADANGDVNTTCAAPSVGAKSTLGGVKK